MVPQCRYALEFRRIARHLSVFEHKSASGQSIEPWALGRTGGLGPPLCVPYQTQGLRGNRTGIARWLAHHAEGRSQERGQRPEYFWKVYADLDGDAPKAIAFVMSNAKQEYPVMSYAVPVDSVEKLTGIDFFPDLDDALEDRIEALATTSNWYSDNDPKAGEVAPLKAPLPKGMFNSTQAKYHVGKTVTVCGTVVSSRTTVKAKAVYLNFDTANPDEDFYATIWQNNTVNFSYDLPETWLLRQNMRNGQGHHVR